MKIGRIVNAAIGATLDRRDVTVLSRKLDKLDSGKYSYYKILKEISGPSVHKPSKVVKNWVKAYHANIERQKMIERLNAPFKHETLASKIVTKVVRKFGRK